MPRAIIQLILYIPEFTNSPEKRAMNSVFYNVLTEKISKAIGYEATLADVVFSIKTFETFGLKCKFKGYNHKLGEFVCMFVKLFAEMAENGLTDSEDFLLSNAVE
jgi:secreted Zn-dependent insulinase-like peptidase